MDADNSFRVQKWMLNSQLQLSYIPKMSVRLYVCMWSSPDQSFYGIAFILHMVLSGITGMVLVKKKIGPPCPPTLGGRFWGILGKFQVQLWVARSDQFGVF